MKEYGFAVNLIKLQRAIAAAKGDDSKVYDLYVAMGGKVMKGYEKQEEPKEKVVLDMHEGSRIVLEVNEKDNLELKEITTTPESTPSIPAKKRGRPAKNAK